MATLVADSDCIPFKEDRGGLSESRPVTEDLGRSEKEVPSGELTFCHGKSPFLMGKSTINCHFQ